jgi:hypothetical protein
MVSDVAPCFAAGIPHEVEVKLLRVVVALIIFCVAVSGGALYVVVYHSTFRDQLKCNGHWRNDPFAPEVVYVRLTHYRSWVRLWSSSNGNVTAQASRIPISVYISETRKTEGGVFAHYSFYDLPNEEGSLGPYRGGYRAATREIVIEFGSGLVFAGACEVDARS